MKWNVLQQAEEDPLLFTMFMKVVELAQTLRRDPCYKPVYWLSYENNLDFQDDLSWSVIQVASLTKTKQDEKTKLVESSALELGDIKEGEKQIKGY